MRKTLLAVLAPLALILTFACGGSEPAAEPEEAPMAEMANPADRFAGAWELVRRERRDAERHGREAAGRQPGRLPSSDHPSATWA